MVANGGKHATKMNIILRMPIENGFNVINKTISSPTAIIWIIG